jgi:hypothetical protein
MCGLPIRTTNPLNGSQGFSRGAAMAVMTIDPEDVGTELVRWDVDAELLADWCRWQLKYQPHAAKLCGAVLHVIACGTIGGHHAATHDVGGSRCS